MKIKFHKHRLNGVHEATAEVKKLLKDPLNWKNYTELDYYKDLDALY